MSGAEDTGQAATGTAGNRLPQPTRSKAEQAFLISFIAATLLATFGFVLATIIGGFGFPSTLVAILMGLCVATLVYTFLGGVEGAVFKLPGFQLAGAAAVIIGTMYLVNGPLRDDMNNAKAIAIGKKAEDLIAAEVNKTEEERSRRRKAEETVRGLKDEVQDRAANSKGRAISSIGDIAAAVRSSSAATTLGKEMIAIQRAGEGPWARVLGDEDVVGRFNGKVDAGTFQYCHKKWPQFKNRLIRFRVANAEAVGAADEEISLSPGGDIGPDCSRNLLSYSVKLGCDSVAKLIPLQVKNCSAQGGVLWNEGANRTDYKLYAIIENTDLS